MKYISSQIGLYSFGEDAKEILIKIGFDNYVKGFAINSDFEVVEIEGMITSDERSYNDRRGSSEPKLYIKTSPRSLLSCWFTLDKLRAETEAVKAVEREIEGRKNNLEEDIQQIERFESLLSIYKLNISSQIEPIIDPVFERSHI